MATTMATLPATPASPKRLVDRDEVVAGLSRGQDAADHEHGDPDHGGGHHQPPAARPQPPVGQQQERQDDAKGDRRRPDDLAGYHGELGDQRQRLMVAE
jgi:hypothetical protein